MKNTLIFALYLVIAISAMIWFSLTGNINPYSFPPATQALEILKYGKILTIYQGEKSYWKETLTSEIEYPVPSTLLAIFYLIINIPFSLLPFLPITGFVLLVFYLAILKTLLKIDRITNLIKEKLYLSSLFLTIILFDIFKRSDAHYVGRATLGVTFLVIYSYMLLLFTDRANGRRLFLPLLVITIIVSYTYYTASLAIFIINVFYILFIYTFNFSNFDSSKRSYILVLAIASSVVIVIRPVISLLGAIPLSPERFVNNLMSWILTRLRLEQGEASMFFGEMPLDLFTRVSTVWLGYLIILLSISAYIHHLFNFLNKVIKSKTSTKTLQELGSMDIFAIIAISCVIAELFYTFVVPIISLRLISIFSVFYIPHMLIRIRASKTQNAVAILITLLFILFYVGTCRSVALYGKVDTAKYIQGISSYISFNDVIFSKVTITGDSYYTGYLWFMYVNNGLLSGTLHSNHEKVLFTILDRNIYDLFGCCDTNRTIYSIEKLIKDYTNVMLVVVNDGKPIRGTAWGYPIMPSPINVNFLLSNMNIIYNDHYSSLLDLTIINFT